MVTEPAGPVRLQVEVTAACNLRCRMCIVRYRPPVDRVSGTLSLDCFERILDEVPTAEEVVLQGIGEPLLVPHLVEMVTMASRRGLTVGFNTNATVLTATKAERLIRAGLTWMCISLDGASAPTYEDVRDGARFARVVRNIESFVAIKRRLGAENPALRIVFVAMRRNVAELPALVRLAAGWGIDCIRVQNLSHTFSDAAAEGLYPAIRSYAEEESLWTSPDRTGAAAIFERARLEAEELGVQLRLPNLDEPAATVRPVGTPGCRWPWEGSYINFDGAVQPCCMLMGSERGRLGHLGEQSFTEIWEGPAYRQFRARLMSEDPPEVCAGCSEYRQVF